MRWPATTRASLPSMAATAARTGLGSEDSRSNAVWASTTTPVAPPTTAAAAVWRPMPPCTHTGASVVARTCWSSTNAPVVPTRLPPGGEHPGFGHHDGAHGVGQVLRGERAPLPGPDGEGSVDATGHDGECLPGPRRVRAEVEHAEGAGAGGRDHQLRRGFLERRLDPDQVVLTGARKTVGHHESPSSPSIVRSAPRGRRRHCGPYRRGSPPLLT